MNVKAVISYDGGFFSGFQKQNSTQQTVTTQIENALKSLNINSKIIGSGRTDAGVHATGQIINFNLPNYWRDLKKLKEALNRKLNHIFIKLISKVDKDFHARFSAKRRVYRYVFKDKKPSIFEENYISYYSLFDEDILKEALKLFEGIHDFKFFYKTGSPIHTTVREIYKTRYMKRGDYHFIYFEANGFLRAQVRMMIEAIMLTSNNILTILELKEQIDAKKRYIDKLSSPKGLYLARIIY